MKEELKLKGEMETTNNILSSSINGCGLLNTNGLKSYYYRILNHTNQLEIWSDGSNSKYSRVIATISLNFQINNSSMSSVAFRPCYRSEVLLRNLISEIYLKRKMDNKIDLSRRTRNFTYWNNRSFEIECWSCGDPSHFTRDCPTKFAVKANFRPSWFPRDTLRQRVEAMRGMVFETMFNGYPIINFSKGEPVGDNDYLNYYGHERINARTIYKSKWLNFRNNTYIPLVNNMGYGNHAIQLRRLCNTEEELQVKVIDRKVKKKLILKYGISPMVDEGLIYPHEFPPDWTISTRDRYGPEHVDYYGYNIPNIEPNIYWDEVDKKIENNFHLGCHLHRLLSNLEMEGTSCANPDCYSCYFTDSGEARAAVFNKKMEIKQRIIKREQPVDYLMVSLDYSKNQLWGEEITDTVDSNSNQVAVTGMRCYDDQGIWRRNLLITSENGCRTVTLMQCPTFCPFGIRAKDDFNDFPLLVKSNNTPRGLLVNDDRHFIKEIKKRMIEVEDAFKNGNENQKRLYNRDVRRHNPTDRLFNIACGFK